MLTSELHTHFLEVSAHTLLKVTTKSSFRGKKSKTLAFWGYFSELKREKYDQKVWSVPVSFPLLYPAQLHF